LITGYPCAQPDGFRWQENWPILVSQLRQPAERRDHPSGDKPLNVMALIPARRRAYRCSQANQHHSDQVAPARADPRPCASEYAWETH